MSTAEQNSDKAELRQGGTTAASDVGPDDAQSSGGPSEERVTGTPVPGSDVGLATFRHIVDGEARETRESSVEAMARVTSAVNRPVELALSRAIAPYQRQWNEIIQQAVPPRLSDILDQNLLQPKLAELVASTRMVGVVNVSRAFTFPSPDISRILAELSGPALYRLPLFDYSAAMCALVQSQQLQLEAVSASLSRAVGLQLTGSIRATLEASVSRLGLANAALRDVSALITDVKMFPVLTGPSAAAYNRHLDRLPLAPTLTAGRFASRAGDAAAGLVASEVLWTADRVQDAGVVAEYVYEALVEPWVDPSSSFRGELRERLERAVLGLADKLDFGWQIVSDDRGPARSSVALQVTEVLNHLLRKLAPVESVAGWLRAGGRTDPKWWFENRAKEQEPTRSAKLAYAMRHRDRRESDLVLIYEIDLSKTLTVTMDEGNRVKHGPAPGGQRSMQSLLMNCEALINLVLPDLDP